MAGITIDLAGAMDKITPEMLKVLDKSMTETLTQRVKDAEEVLKNVMLAIAFAPPEVLNDTLWMPGNIEPNATVYDYLALAKQRICHPDTETELTPCTDECCDRYGEAHFLADDCEDGS